MNRDCLILGGHGFIGSAIVRAASDFGWAATAAGRADLEKCACQHWNLIINANGNSKKYLSAKDPLLDFDLSVRSVAHSLHTFSFDRYLFLSSVDVYADKANPSANHEEAAIDPAALSRYGQHKWMAEELVRWNAANWLIVRMAGFVGPGLRKNSVYDLLKGHPLRVHPDSAYQYQNCDDAATLLFQLLELPHRNECFNLAGDGVISLRDVASFIPYAQMPGETADLPVEHYEINVDKLKNLLPVPRTIDVVHRFVENVLTGNISLA